MRTVEALPRNAQALLRAVCWQRNVAVEVILNLEKRVAPPRLRRIRHDAWAALAAMPDADGCRMYSDAEIAGWFGVTRPAVSIALKNARQAEGLVLGRASRIRGK